MARLSEKKTSCLVAIALAIGTAAVYWDVVSHPFVNYDDPIYVTGNLQVHQGIRWETVAWAFKTCTFGNWLPLAWLTHLLDYQVYGMNAAGHHFTSLLIHVINTVLLFLVLKRLTGALWKSGFVAALFAMHPLNVESVAWIAERKNILCTLFWILGIWAYSWYAGKPNWKRYMLTLGVFGLGLMAKSMVVTLPFVLLLLDFWPLGRVQKPDDPAVKGTEDVEPSTPRTGEPRRRNLLALVLEKVPFLLLAAADGIITLKLQRDLGTISRFPVRIRIENAIVSYAAYLEKMIWPSKLSVLYPHPRSYLPGLRVAVAAAVLLCISVAVIWGYRRWKYVGVGWLWFLGTLVPVIGLIQAGAQSMADRYAYIPLIGIFIVVVWGLSDVVEHYRRARDYVIVAAVCGLFTLVTVTRVQLGYWSSSLALWQHAMEVTENNYVAYNNFGEALWAQGKYDLAGPWFFKSIDVFPAFANAQINAGMVLARNGEVDEAISHLIRGVELDPESCEGYNKLGAAFGKKGMTEEAVRCFEMALRINPKYVPALGDLALELEHQGRFDEASAALERAIECGLNPELAPELHLTFGDVLVKKGESSKAIDHYREALRLRPGYAPALEALNKIQEGGG
jgi:tetratricopeptide (TPR) repeat protein